MTDLQYGIIGLVLLAVVMNFGKLLSFARGTGQPAQSPKPGVTISTTPEPAKPHDAASLASLFHQSIQAAAHVRAVSKSVEELIEAQSQTLALPWAGKPAAPPTAPTTAPTTAPGTTPPNV